MTKPVHTLRLDSVPRVHQLASGADLVIRGLARDRYVAAVRIDDHTSTGDQLADEISRMPVGP